MKVTTELLKSLGNIPTEKENIVNIIKEHITNVESYHDLENDYRGIIVAEIIEKKDHPDADKLGVYTIFTGNDKIQVVAGDKTLEIGNKVAYIPPGSIVPHTIYTEVEPFVIGKVKLRGIESNGMLGSEKELNIGPDHNFVMKLPIDAPVGTPFAEYYTLEDLVIDIENKGLTNRGDLFGLIGIARELTAITGNRFESPDWYRNKKKEHSPESNCLPLQVINDAEALCPRYIAIVLDDLTVQESPIWLKSTLVKLGVKPLNNIVDITNYISALFGQPMHAFDYDKVVNGDPLSENGAIIHIRMAREEEKILALDNQVYTLNDRAVVIADNSHPIAIAGVIGGKDTAVDMNTKKIIFESANFDKNSTRRTSMMLGISTDAATKFKHSLDPEVCLPALLKAIELAKELADGKVASEIVDVYTEPYEERIVTIDIEKLNSHIGLTLEEKEIKTILENLEYKIVSSNKNMLTVSLPSWRRDVTIKEDIHEDIARVYGYNNIEMKLPKKEISATHKDPLFSLKSDIRKTFADLGLNEVLTYSFTNLENFRKCGLDSNLSFKIKNPLSPELSLMRISLLQSLLEKTRDNAQRGFTKFGLFELNTPHINTYKQLDLLPKEEWHLSSIITDSIKNSQTSSYYLAKKYVDRILEIEGYENSDYVLIADSTEQDLPEDIKAVRSLFDPNVSAILYVDKTAVGIIGEIKDGIKDTFKLPVYTVGIDLNLSRLLEIRGKKKSFREVPIYPVYSLDVCFETSTGVLCESMRKELYDLMNDASSWAEVECLDIYKEKKESEKKRTTFRIVASNYSKTVGENDIKKIREKIEKRFKAKFEAIIV